MIRFEAQALRSIAATVAVLFSTLSAQSAAAADADREQQLVDQIQEIVSRDGPYSTDLLAPLEGLALFYAESGDHSFALVALERALQVTRVNRGLHTLDQVPLITQKIHHEEARGNHAEAWELEQGLLRLIRRHPEDLRTASMLREIADRQMATLHDYLEGDETPEVVYGCFYKQWPNADSGSCNAGSRKVVVQGMLAEAQRNYADAITIMLDHGLYGSPELRDLEMALLHGVDFVRSLYERPGTYAMPMVPATLTAEHLEPWRGRIAPLMELASWGLQYSSDGDREAEALRKLETKHSSLMLTYSRGRQSLRRLHAYEAASESSPVARAEAIAKIADWDLLYSYNGRAVEGYEMARALLQQAGASAASIDEVLAPPTPVVLPAFKENPLASDETRPTTGYIDVAFTITKYGRARDIEIRTAANATEDAQTGLVRFIDRSRFRPRLVDGEFADVTPVAFRYHLHD